MSDDEIAFEESEIFEVVLETPPNVSSSSPNPSRVFIIDDDGKLHKTLRLYIFIHCALWLQLFECRLLPLLCELMKMFQADLLRCASLLIVLALGSTPLRLEGDQSETTQQLVRRREKLLSVDLLVSFLTAIEDYTINNADLIVTIPAGEPMEQCIPVGIVDDDVALEGEETFQFFFVTLEPGVLAGDQSEAVVTIVDDDGSELITKQTQLHDPLLITNTFSDSSFFHHPCCASQ